MPSQSSSAGVLHSPSASSSRKRSRGVDGVLNLGKRQKNPNANVPIFRLPSSLLVNILSLAGGNHALVSRGFSEAQNILSARKHNYESLKVIWLKLCSKSPNFPVIQNITWWKIHTKAEKDSFEEKNLSIIRKGLNGNCLKKITTLMIGKGAQNAAGECVRSVPSEIRKFTWLKSLTFQHTKLRELHDAIGTLPRLEMLYLKDNQITSLPKAIEGLANLRFLGLQKNQLRSLPEEIGGLLKLKGLRLGNNQLQSLPKAIGDLSNLTELSLPNNQLSSLPKEIKGLAKLKLLNLQNNQLSSLPKEIGGLAKLKSLNLQNNQLSSLPEVIGDLARLGRLRLEYNKFRNVPEACRTLQDSGRSVPCTITYHSQKPNTSSPVGDYMKELIFEGSFLGSDLLSW